MDNTPLNIILADDDKADQLLFKEAFEELALNTIVKTVNNGSLLMEYLNHNPLLPDLVFLDLNMPGKNGLECLKEIRGTERLSEIVIAIYSTSAHEKDIEETFYNGANVYIKKPNDFNLLKRALEKVVMASFQYREVMFNKDLFLLRV